MRQYSIMLIRSEVKLPRFVYLTVSQTECSVSQFLHWKNNNTLDKSLGRICGSYNSKHLMFHYSSLLLKIILILYFGLYRKMTHFF